MPTERVPPDQRDRQADYRRQHHTERPAEAPPPTPRVSPLRRAIIWGGVTEDAIEQRRTLDRSWLNLVSADRGTWGRSLDQLVSLSQTGPVEVWCDCRVVDGTHPQAAIDLANLLGVGWVGQAESRDELEAAVGIHPMGGLIVPAGTERARRLIGNPNAWEPEQQLTAIRMIHEGDLSVSGEQYAGPDAMATYSAGGVPVDSITVGVAMDKGVHYSLSDFPVLAPTILVWHGGGLRPDDWEVLRGL